MHGLSVVPTLRVAVSWEHLPASSRPSSACLSPVSCPSPVGVLPRQLRLFPLIHAFLTGPCRLIGRCRSPQGGGTGPGRVRSRRPQSRGGGRSSGPFAGWGSSGERGAAGPSARRPAVHPYSRAVGTFPRQAGPSVRVVCPSLSARPSVPSLNRPAVRVLTAHAALRGEAGGGAAGVLTRMARSLTLARWGTNDAYGAPAHLGALGY